MNEFPLRDVFSTEEFEQDCEFFAGVEARFEEVRIGFEWIFARSPMSGPVAIIVRLPTDGRLVRLVGHVTDTRVTMRSIEFALENPGTDPDA